MNNFNLEDIAKKSGVSRSTVSRVINDHPNVSKKVRERVQEVIKQTGYQPHAAARALVSNRSWTCGLILPRTINSFFADPYFPSLIQGIAQSCSKNNYTLSLFLSSGKDDEDNIFNRVTRRGFLDGVLVQSGNIGDQLINKIAASGIPLVVLGRPFNNRKISFVDIDNMKAVESVVDHLIQTGHRRIGTITGPLITTVGIDRKQGYINSLEKNGFPIDESLIFEGNFNEESGYLGMKKLFVQSPDAVFTSSDRIALGAIRAINENGLLVPDDISIIGFDDFPMAPPNKPFLTTVRQPIFGFGDTAVRILIELVENGTCPPRQEILGTEFIQRTTSKTRH